MSPDVIHVILQSCCRIGYNVVQTAIGEKGEYLTVNKTMFLLWLPVTDAAM